MAAIGQAHEISVIWNQNMPEIRGSQVTLRPIQPEDLPVYQKLFMNAVAMGKYLNGPRDITDRFHKWLGRWKVHPYSALAVVDSDSKKVIGHAVLGHGDYEGNFDKGFSEDAVILEPAYWNCGHKDEARGIGIAGKKHIGSEVVRACIAYARSLKERNIPVPCDVTAKQRPDLEEALKQRQDLKVHRNEEGDIDWIYLPLTELRATTRTDNIGMHKILEHHHKTSMEPYSQERDLFVIRI